VKRLPAQELDDIRVVACEVDAYANAVDDIRKLLGHIEVLSSENYELYKHLHGVHFCNCDLGFANDAGEESP
jgi:hypothetical protein